jgi:hypothetical protein
MSHHTIVAFTLVVVLGISGAQVGDGRQARGGFDPLRDALSSNEPQPIYAPDPADPWNRLFHLLFTRTIDASVIREGATVFAAGDDRLALSDRRITRIESGDRAIDPLYPSWVWMDSTAFDMSPQGAWGILKEPRYSQFVSALTAVRESADRQPRLARALMQADLWAVYDLFEAAQSSMARRHDRSAEGIERRRRIEDVLPRVADSIRALALTRAEVASLPDTYAAAVRSRGLPDLFDARSDWVEVLWFPARMHERAVNDRRAVRVFLKPAHGPVDQQALLNRLRDAHGDNLSALEAAALLVQTLLVATDGSVIPSRITYEIQVRRNSTRASEPAEVLQYELSRRRVLSSPADGFASFDEYAPAYLPMAGNDFSFATPSRIDAGPVIATLRDRCLVCHGPGIGKLATFAMTAGPGRLLPPVERLTASEHRHPKEVAARKMTREDFRSLQRHWSTSPRQRSR